MQTTDPGNAVIFPAESISRRFGMLIVRTSVLKNRIYGELADLQLSRWSKNRGPFQDETSRLQQRTYRSPQCRSGGCAESCARLTLAYMAEMGDKRIASASFLTTQTDFSQAGDLRILVDEDHLRALEEKMAATGYLEASAMATEFNMLRPEDLIWFFLVNNYLKGKQPLAFDLLAWNSDSTRMTAANHLTYLRQCYLENGLTKGEAVLGGKTLNLSKVTIPVYHLQRGLCHIAK